MTVTVAVTLIASTSEASKDYTVHGAPGRVSNHFTYVQYRCSVQLRVSLGVSQRVLTLSPLQILGSGRVTGGKWFDKYDTAYYQQLKPISPSIPPRSYYN